MTFNDAIKYYENFGYTKEYYELLKEGFELELMQQYADNQAFIESDTYVENAEVLDGYFQEAASKEDLTNLMKNIGTKTAEFASKIWKKFIALLKVMGKFFAAFGARIKRVVTRKVKYVLSLTEIFKIAITTSGKNKDSIKGKIINSALSASYIMFGQALKESKLEVITSNPTGDPILDMFKVILWNIAAIIRDHGLDSDSALMNPGQISGLVNDNFKNPTNAAKKIEKKRLNNEIVVIVDPESIQKECDKIKALIDIIGKAMDTTNKAANTANATDDKFNDMNKDKYNKQVKNLANIMKYAAASMDFYNRFSILYDAGIKFADNINHIGSEIHRVNKEERDKKAAEQKLNRQAKKVKTTTLTATD